jgi:tetratricopeptide (TPR) repeat protein
VLVAGCSSGPDLLEVPTPPALSEVEEPLRAQYQERREALDRLLADRKTPSLALARAFASLGAWALAYRYLDSAEPALENAARLDPADWSSTYYLAHVHRERGDAERALAAFQRVLERAPDDVPTLVWLGELELDRGQVEDAARRFDAAVRLDPRSARAIAGQGRAALLAKDPARAAERLRAALALEPEAPEIHYLLGLAYRGLGQLDRAREELARGVTDGESHRSIPLRDPLRFKLQELNVSADLFARRAREALSLGRIDEAVEQFRAAVAAAPENASLRLGLGNALVRAERRADAVSAYREALRLEPANSSAHYNLGLVLEHDGQAAESEQHYRAAIAADPRHARAHERLGAQLAARGEGDAALPHFAAAIRDDPNAESPRLARAKLLLALGRVEEAVQALEADVASVPRSAALQGLLAEASAREKR